MCDSRPSFFILQKNQISQLCIISEKRWFIQLQIWTGSFHYRKLQETLLLHSYILASSVVVHQIHSVKFLFIPLIFQNISGFAIKHLANCRKGGKSNSGSLIVFDLGHINVRNSHALGKLTRHVEELLSCLNTDNALKITYHHRERMGANNRADAVNSILILFTVCRKRRIDRFLESCESIC